MSDLDAIIYDLRKPKLSDYPSFDFEDLRVVAEAAFELGMGRCGDTVRTIKSEARRDFAREAHKRLLETNFMDSDLVGFELWLREEARDE